MGSVPSAEQILSGYFLTLEDIGILQNIQNQTSDPEVAEPSELVEFAVI